MRAQNTVNSPIYPREQTEFTIRPQWRVRDRTIASTIQLRYVPDEDIFEATVDDHRTMRVVRKPELLDENCELGQLVLKEYETNGDRIYDLSVYLLVYPDHYRVSAYLVERRRLSPDQYTSQERGEL
jgi:hypothetical protein